MKQCLRQDILYYIKKPYIFVFILLNVILCLSTIYNGYMTANHDIEDYRDAKNSFENDEELSFAYPDGSYFDIETQDDVDAMKNIAEESVTVINPAYTVEYSMLSIGLMALILFSIFAISYFMIDEKNRMIRVKVSRYGRKEIIMAKHIGMIIFGTMIAVLSVTISYVINLKLYGDFEKKYPIVKKLDSTKLLVKNDIVKKIIVYIIIIVVSMELGAMIVSIIKNELMASIIVVVFGMIVPIIGKYDLRACLGDLVVRYYNCIGPAKITANRNGNIFVDLCICGIFLLASFKIGYNIFKVRSAY